MSTELVKVESGTSLSHYRQASDAAGVCKQIVVKTAMQLQGRKYVRVEGWQAIANAFGCVASARSVERVETGFRAIGEVRRVADGVIVAEAEGFVGDDETKTWANRPEYAKRAMAQTRAISRACRSAFGFVVVMMDAGLDTTPAEEMEYIVEPEPVKVRPRFQPPATRQEPAPSARATADDMQRSRLAVNRASDTRTLEVHRDTVFERLESGFYTREQADELHALISGRLDLLAGGTPQEVA